MILDTQAIYLRGAYTIYAYWVPHFLKCIKPYYGLSIYGMHRGNVNQFELQDIFAC